MWQKIYKIFLPLPIHKVGSWEEIYFSGCTTATDIFLKLLGDTLEHIIFQTYLYGTQKNKTEQEIFTFTGIHFFKGYHILPSIDNYWSTADDFSTALVHEIDFNLYLRLCTSMIIISFHMITLIHFTK